MAKASLLIRVSDPWEFETQNGTGELFGEIDDWQDVTASHWEVRLSDRFRLNDHSFDRVLVSPRHEGGELAQLFSGESRLPVTLAYPEPNAADIANGRSWRLGMTGSVELRPKAG